MNRERGGFTLIELIIVIVILGILAAIALPRYYASLASARQAEAQSTMAAICEVESGYWANGGAYYAGAVSGTFQQTVGSSNIAVAPNTTNWTYSTTGTTSTAYVTATAVSSGDAAINMCLASGKASSGCP